MKTLDEFKLFYDGELTGTLNELEVERKKGVRYVLYMVLAFFVSAAIVGIELLMPIHVALFVVAGVLFVTCLIVFIVKLNRVKKAVKIKYKEEVIKRIVEFVDPGLHYNATACVSQSEFSGSKIFLKGIDRYNGDDLVQGTIGKTDARFSEVHSEYYTTDKDGKRQYHTIFKGIFFIAEFHKDFIGETIVLPDTAEKMFGKFGAMLQKMNVSRPKLVKLEDPVFEKEFVVYGSDQVEARYILTPALMSRIMDFKKKSGKIYLSFLHSKVYIAISVRKNLFEPPFFKSMLRFELIEEYFNYLILSVNIVEDLDLNTRIWSKK